MFLRLFILSHLLIITAIAQSGLQPKYDIPPTIAKLPEYSDFLGFWQRADGGYSLQVEPTDQTANEVNVQYFNPAPIHVETATFDEDEMGQPRLTVVLRDEGYPGSTYRLIYLAERQVLVGIYARPGEEGAQVYFVQREAGD